MRTLLGGAAAAVLLAAAAAHGVPPPAAAQSGGLSDAMARRALAAQGLGEIEELRRHGGSFVGRGTLHGESVHFRADAHTGELREPERLSEGQIRVVLAAAGYDDVAAIERTGETYRTQAARAGRRVSLSLDARRGTVIRQEVLAE